MKLKHLLGWTSVIVVLSQATSMIRLLVSAFFLTPDEMGLYAVSASVYAGLLIISEFGAKQLYISGLLDGITCEEKTLNTVWLTNVILRVILFLISLLAGICLQFFDGFEGVFGIVLILSLSLLISSLTNKHLFKQEKLGNFKLSSFTEGGANILSLSVLSLYIFFPASIYYLVYSQLAAAILFVFLSYVLLPIGKKLEFELKVLKRILAQGKNIVVISMSTYLTYSLDKLIIAFVISKEVAGVYFIAQKITEVPGQFLTSIASKALLPFYRFLEETGRDVKPQLSKYILMILAVGLCLSAIFILIDIYFNKYIEYKNLFSIAAVLVIGTFFRASCQLIGPFLIVRNLLAIDAKFKIQEAAMYSVLMPLSALYFGLNGMMSCFVLIYMVTLYRRYNKL